MGVSAKKESCSNQLPLDASRNKKESQLVSKSTCDEEDSEPINLRTPRFIHFKNNPTQPLEKWNSFEEKKFTGHHSLSLTANSFDEIVPKITDVVLRTFDADGPSPIPISASPCSDGNNGFCIRLPWQTSSEKLNPSEVMKTPLVLEVDLPNHADKPPARNILKLIAESGSEVVTYPSLLFKRTSFMKKNNNKYNSNQKPLRFKGLASTSRKSAKEPALPTARTAKILHSTHSKRDSKLQLEVPISDLKIRQTIKHCPPPSVDAEMLKNFKMALQSPRDMASLKSGKHSGATEMRSVKVSKHSTRNTGIPISSDENFTAPLCVKC